MQSRVAKDSIVAHADEVEFAYTKLWQVAKVYQNVKGEVDFNTGTGAPNAPTVVVSYGYGSTAAPTSGSDAANFSRLTSMTYPSGNVVNYGYGSSSDLDYRISRARSLADPNDSDNIVEYSRVGLDLFAIVDYPLSDVQLDRTFSRDGKRTWWSGQGISVFPGWDRHGRVAIHAWMDGWLDEGSNGLPSRPPILDEGHTYDKASNRATKYDMRPGAPASIKPDWQYFYDHLDRLTEARKNVRTANPFDALVGSQKWVLDVLGNWDKHQRELDGTITPNSYLGSGETEDRDHNEANEITNRYPQGSPTPVLPFAYDHAGNLRDQKISASTTSVFTHDAWNRLVKHIYTVTGGSSLTSIHYEYNGLHWRTINKNLTGAISEEEESGNSGTLKEMYYSAAWQLLEERIDEDCVTTPGINRIAQEVWGLRYIDDAVMRTASVGDEGGNERKFYHLTDAQFSTVAMLPVGALRTPVYERVAYEPYGKATHRWAGDVNDDGAVNSTDVGLVTTAAAANSGAGYTMGVHSAYDVRMDINRDGLVDSDDEDIFVALPALAFLGIGEISDRSADGPDNVFGYDGYVFAPELSRYCVRFRWYDPVTGRWMERDPAGYVDGQLLYAYGRHSPVKYTDSNGRRPEQPEVVDPSVDPKNPANNKALGCGIKVKQADVGNGYGHRWIEIEDPGRGKPGDVDYRPRKLSRVGRQPFGWVSPYRDPKPGCPQCTNDDVPSKEPPDTQWDTAPIQDWRELHTPNLVHDALEHGPYKGTLYSAATCEQIRMCLYKASGKRQDYDYTGHLYGENCRTAIDDALKECGLEMTNKQRTPDGRQRTARTLRMIIRSIIESGLPMS